MSEIKSALELCQWIVNNYGMPTGVLILGYVLLIISLCKTRKEKAAWEHEERKQKEREIELNAREAAIKRKELYIESLERELQSHRNKRPSLRNPSRSEDVENYLD